MAVTTPAAALSTPMPPFTLPGVDGRTYQASDFAHAQCLLVLFTCNHCPYAQAVEGRVISLQHAYAQSDMQLVAICSNDVSAYPDDSFDNLKARWAAKKMPFPYLHDAEQAVAKSFGAVCTPDFFLYDRHRALRYRGRLDDNWQEPANVQKHELRDAIDRLLSGKSPATQNPSIGCSIKWRG
jgi:peroxiredoxin